MTDRTDMPPGSSPQDAAVKSALAELALCENLSHVSGWAARWSAALSGADGALVWVPDELNKTFLCISAHGPGTEASLRRSTPRSEGTAWQLVRDREPLLLDREQLAASDDPWTAALPDWTQRCLAVPLVAENSVSGLLALLFSRAPTAQDVLDRLSGFMRYAAPALSRALRAERKTVGMLHAIERLTNLYDLSKAFGSTIEWDELSAIIARKAVDFGNGEFASLWVLEGDEGEVALAATAVNENYDIDVAPEAVGIPVIADLVSGGVPVVVNDVPEDDPLRGEHVRAYLGVPLFEDDAPVGALVIANKRGRHPEFNDADVELLVDLGHQAVRALRNARRYEAEKKVEELDALLAVSREITSTLDLDRVMSTVVNSTAALVRYDRCAIGILQRGRLRLGAVSGQAEVNLTDPSIRRTSDLLEWVFFSGHDVSIRQEDDGTIDTDRAETREKFRSFFEASGMRFFHGVILQDEEGKLGVLGFESAEPLVFDQDTRDILQILVNQATVALRNAQLYGQVPLAGFWKPILEKRRKLAEIPWRKRKPVLIGGAVALFLLLVLPWRLRVVGPTRVLPEKRVTVTAGVEGVIQEVRHREGDFVRAGDVIATLRADAYQAALARARADIEIAESDIARFRAEGDAAGTYQAEARRDEARARITAAEAELQATRLTAPVSGVIVTPRLEDRVGERLGVGGELCVLGDLAAVTAEVAVPEKDGGLLRPGEKVRLKLNPFPTRTFQGVVTRVGAEVRQEGADRFLVAESRIANPDGILKAGMLGKAKIYTVTRRWIVAILRKPAQYIWAKLWPALP
jgi:RND family efflux transporter MFP subunit